GRVEYVAQAVDAAGNASFFTAQLAITFERTMPPPTVILDAAFASSRFGAGAQTTLTSVTLDGTAKAGSTVIVVGTALFTTADKAGKFTFTGVPVHPGANVIEVRSTDSAGNSGRATLTVTMHDVDAPAV